MTFPNPSRPSGNEISKFKKGLEQLSECIKDLSRIVPSDESSECSQFKKNQLHNLLLDESDDMSLMLKGSKGQSEIYDHFLKSSSHSVNSHLAVTNVKDIGCHYDDLSEHTDFSILDLHTGKDNWCLNCSTLSSNEPNFKKGIVNRFTCWRRGHSSGKLGFLQCSELIVMNDKIVLQVKKTFTSKELQAIAYAKFQNNLIQVGEKVHGTSMVCLIHINSQRNKETNRISEIRGLLDQQLLVSKSISLPQQKKATSKNQSRKKIPQFIEELLESVHSKWNLDGPSKDSKGLIGMALIHNDDKFTQGSTFQNILHSFSTKNSIWLKNYPFSNLPNTLKLQLDLSDRSIPPGSSILCLIADPIIDLGGNYFA